MAKTDLQRVIDSRRGRSGNSAVSFSVSGGGGGGGGEGVTDHGLLTGLGDDDHTQYLNVDRGNALYVPLARTITAGNGLTGGGALSANITLNAAVSGLGLSVTSDAIVLTSSSAPTDAQILASNSTGGLSLQYLNLGTSSSDLEANLISPGHLVMSAARSVWLIIDSDAVGTENFIIGRNNPDPDSALELFRFTEAGRLGIGTQTPAYSIDVIGSISASVKMVTPLIITEAATNLTIQPTGDLYLSPEGLDTIVDYDSAFRSDNYAKSILIAGFRIGPTQIPGQTSIEAGSAEFDELRARFFVADETRVDRGQEFITKSYAVLSRDFEPPTVINQTAFIYVENSPHFPNGQLFTNGDFVMLRFLSLENGITLTSVYGQVDSYNISGLEGEQRWTFRLRQGLPADLGEPFHFPEGALVVNFGASGQGFILTDAVTATAPFQQVARWVTNPWTPANIQILAQMGRLDGVGFTGEYGFAASVTGFEDDESWIKFSNSGARLNNVPIQIYSGGQITGQWSASGQFDIGFTDGIGTEVNRDFTINTTGYVRIGRGTTNYPNIFYSKTGGYIAIRSGINEKITLDSAGNSYFSGVMTIGNDGEIRQGTGTLGSNFTGLRLWRDTNVGRIGGYKSNILQWYGDTTGEFRAGTGLVSLSADGVGLQKYSTATLTPISGTEAKAAVSFWSDINNRTGAYPVAKIYGSGGTAGAPGSKTLVLEVGPDVTGTQPSIWLESDPLIGKIVWFNGFTQILGIPGASFTLSGSTPFVDLEGVRIRSTIKRYNFSGTQPTINIGEAGFPFDNLYANNIVAGTISGTSMSGNIWASTANMQIDAASASNTTLTITNSNFTGRMDLIVDRNITLGGTINSIDLTAFYNSYNAHTHAHSALTGVSADQHHAQIHALDGTDHTGVLSWSKISLVSSGLTPGAVLKVLTSTTFGFQKLQHSDLLDVLPDQHHAQLHALGGSDHTGNLLWDRITRTTTGLTVGHTLVASSATAFGFAQLSHTQLSAIGTNTHAQIDTHIATPLIHIDHSTVGIGAGNGLTGGGSIDVSRTLTLGTPTSIDVSSTNTVTSTSHSHFITTSSNVKDTPQAIILQSNSGGNLQLNALFANIIDLGDNTITESGSELRFNGSLPVDFNQLIKSDGWSITTTGSAILGSANIAQELYVGNSAMRVLFHTTDVEHVHLVINPSPSWTVDEQFGVDIDDNLLVRGYIVGKHALQVPGAKMILHFDGPQPYEENFDGTPIGHMGQKGVISGGAVFREGKFQKAIQIAEATTNLIENPSFQGTYVGGIAPGWVAYSFGSPSGVYTSSGNSYVGTRSQIITRTGGASTDRFGLRANTSTVGSTSASAQIKFRVVSYTEGAIIRLQVDFTGGPTNNTVLHTIVASDVDKWITLSIEGMTPDATDTASFYISISGANASIVVDTAQLEPLPYCTPYCDGSLGGYDSTGVYKSNIGNVWSGTAHSSQSTRTIATLSYSYTVLNPYRGTVMAWVNPSTISGTRTIFRTNGNGGDNYIILRLESGRLRGFWGTSGPISPLESVLVPHEWSHVAMTFNGDVVKLFINGQYSTGGSFSGFSQTTNPVYIGRFGSTDAFNGLIDDVVILDRAAPDDEIRTIYESNAPVFAETAAWQWRAGRNRFWADTEGIWMLNAAGLPMFGAYAGSEESDTATKLWGGVTLSAGDILMGDAGRGGYVQWDDNLSTMVFAGSGGGITNIDGGNIVTNTIDGNRIKLTSSLAIGPAATFGTEGFQAQYNGGAPRVYIGDGANKFFKFQAGNVSWKSGNTELTTSGNLIAVNADLTGAITATTGNITGTLTILSGGKIESQTVDIDNSGLAIQSAIDNWNLSNSLSFKADSIKFASLIGRTGLNFYDIGIFSNTVDGSIITTSTKAGNIRLNSLSTGTFDSLISLTARTLTETSAAFINIHGRDGFTTNPLIDISAATIEISATSGVDGVTINGGTVWHSGNDGLNSGLNADVLRGFEISSIGNFWGVLPLVSNSGVLDIGRFIDFHNSDADTSDFAVRLQTSGTTTDLYINGSKIWHEGNFTVDTSTLMPKSGGTFTGAVVGTSLTMNSLASTTLNISGSLGAIALVPRSSGATFTLYNNTGQLLVFNGTANVFEFKTTGNFIATGSIGAGVEAIGNYKLDVNGWSKFRGPLEILRLTSAPALANDTAAIFIAGSNTTQVRFVVAYKIGSANAIYKFVDLDSGAPTWLTSNNFADVLS